MNDSTPEQRFANQILKMTPEQFNEWADKSSLAEVEYATLMIMVASQQLREEMECLQEEAEYYIEEELEFSDLYDAKTVLSPYTLNGIK